MAGDWIKMRDNLWDDPRVSSLCDATRQGEATIIGGLYWLWAATDQHSEDGVMVGLTLRSIDRKTGIKGFGEALVSIGWLAECEGGVTIPRFDEHNGKSAKARAVTAKRVASHRNGNADVTVPSLQDEYGNVTPPLARVREEKRREEKEQKPSDLVEQGAQESARDPAPDPDATHSTRKGALCQRLRALAINAAPHQAAWAELLPAYSDAEIIAVAELARERKPGERIGLNYLVPMLRDRAHLQKARASPAEERRERQQRNIDILTGRAHEQQPATLIDIN